MANRHLSRSIVVQSLFETDFNNKSEDEALDILRRNAEEFAPGMGDFSFTEGLLKHVLKKKNDLDKIISKAAALYLLGEPTKTGQNYCTLQAEG